MFRALLCAIVFSAGSTARADCSGPLIDQRLSDAERSELQQAVADTPFAAGLFWQAEKDGATIALIGTFHLADLRNAALLNRTKTILASADHLLVEVTAEGELELQAHLGANPDLLLLPDGGSLIERLPLETWNAIAEAAQARQIPPFMAARMQPWFLTMTLSVPPCAMASLAAGELGLDKSIIAQAETAGVPVSAVEEWQTALSLLMQGSFEDQIDMLELSLIDPDLQAEAMASMIDHYFKGEVAKIWELSRITARWLPGLATDEADAIFADFETQLLTDRNAAWMPVILDYSAQNPRLVVAVGAAHLPGKQGLLQALQNQGWQVSRME